MNEFKVALLQLVATSSQEGNAEKGIAYCRQAKAMGADLALFPEMWNNGYHVCEDGEQLRREAVPRDGAFVRGFQDLARQLDMAIGITFLEQYEPMPRNTLCVFDRRGRCTLTYAKVHTCDFEAERNLTPGDDFYVAELDTREGPVAIGAMICYDRGIDMLCDFHEYTTAKQTQSIVRQTGAEGMLSELYGVTGWDYDFRGYKLQGDWQAALGVTVRVPHLAWMTMKGEAKRDYPR